MNCRRIWMYIFNLPSQKRRLKRSATTEASNYKIYAQCWKTRWICTTTDDNINKWLVVNVNFLSVTSFHCIWFAALIANLLFDRCIHFFSLMFFFLSCLFVVWTLLFLRKFQLKIVNFKQCFVYFTWIIYISCFVFHFLLFLMLSWNRLRSEAGVNRDFLWHNDNIATLQKLATHHISFAVFFF